MHNDLGDLEQATSFAKRAVELSSRNPAFHWTYALVLLRAGRFKEGWAEYEWRRERRDFTTLNRDFGKPRWDGSAINGKTILIHAEQGIGDTLQFTRYVALIKKTGASVIVECQPEVANLVSCMEGVRAVVRSGEPFLKFNVQILY